MAQIILANGAAAATPAAGAVSVYSKSADKRLYYKDETGIEVGPLTALTSGFNKNALINGNFSINQRAVSGTVTLAAGVYGQDRFKAGAGGCTYTFSTTNNITVLTISAGTLMQVVEGVNLQSGTYTLSWAGTAQGRIDTGAYGVSGLTGTAAGGVNQTCEWGIGTVSLVQYEKGITATSFEIRQIGLELALCQRYLRGYTGTITSGPSGTYSDANQIQLVFGVSDVLSMRPLPAISTQGVQGTDWAIYSSGGVPQTGFSLSYSNGIIVCSKTAHGLTMVFVATITSLGKFFLTSEI